MSVYSWILPSAPLESAGGGGLASPSPGEPALPGGGADLALDPVTKDAIDTDDGAWLETNDSRTSVLQQLEIEKDAWWVDSSAGSTIAALLRSGEPVTEAALVDAVLTALQPLVVDGLITDLVVEPDRDEVGRIVIVLAYRDRAGLGRELIYSPFTVNP